MIGFVSAADGSRREGERGQAIVLFVIMLVAILTTLALVINGGLLRRSNQELWNALDAGALPVPRACPTNPYLWPTATQSSTPR